MHPPINWPRVALRVHVVRCVSKINADLFHRAACFPVGPDDEFRVGRELFAEELDDLPFAKPSAVSNRITEGMQMVSCRYAFHLGNHLRMAIIRFFAIPALAKEDPIVFPCLGPPPW